MVIFVLVVYAGIVIKDLVPTIKKKDKKTTFVLVLLLIIGLVMSIIYALKVPMVNYIEEFALFLIKKIGLVYPKPS